MRRLLALLTIVCSVCVLSACGPIYRTDYAYVPPKSNSGKMCITQCLTNKSMSEQMCQMRNDNCRAQARQDALYQYESYKRDRHAMGKPVRKTLSDFDTSYMCSNSCDTTPQYNACYASCGGQIFEHQTCTAFCDKQ